MGYTHFLKEEVGMANGLKMALVHAVKLGVVCPRIRGLRCPLFGGCVC